MKRAAATLDPARAIQLIKGSKPQPDGDTTALLAPFAPAVLAEVVASNEPWLVRGAAIRALAGRVDDIAAAVLLGRALDPGEVSNVRCEVLDLLAAAGRTESIEPLRRLLPELAAMPSPPYGVEDAVVSTLARLGDIEAAVPALRLRYDTWSHRRRRGEEAVRALEEAAGRDALSRALGAEGASLEGLAGLSRSHPEAVVRRWAVDVAGADAPFLTAALGDTEWVVTEGAHAALLRSSASVEAPLHAAARDPVATPVVRARAILVLLRRGRVEEAKPLWDALEGRHVALPEVPASVRRAVLHHYLPGERGTDPRWLLEAELDHGFDLDFEREGGPDEAPESVLLAARRALEQAGCAVGEAIPIGAVYQQGGGTYWHLPVDGATLQVSALGRFVTCEQSLSARACDSLEQAGFLFVERELGGRTFDGLGVYFFGRRDPLRVCDLLFYWQD